METYICMLRGINVSGQKLIKMEDLRLTFEIMGFKNVRTYIQSGNIIFESKESNSEDIENLIKKTILNEYGYDVSVMVKQKKELVEVLENNPLIKSGNEDHSKLHVTFLSDTPLEENLKKIKGADYGSGEFFVSGNTVYLYCPDGYGRTKLSNNFFENKLKVTATTRNWKTVTKLVELSDS